MKQALRKLTTDLIHAMGGVTREELYIRQSIAYLNGRKRGFQLIRSHCDSRYGTDWRHEVYGIICRHLGTVECMLEHKLKLLTSMTGNREERRTDAKQGTEE